MRTKSRLDRDLVGRGHCRGRRLGRHRARSRRVDQRRVADRRRGLLVRHRVPLLRALHPVQGPGRGPQPRDARRAAGERPRLPADRPARPVRPPLRGDRGRRPARRPGPGRADGLPAGTIWIIVGVIFAGAVQDMVVLFFSMRRDGKSLGQMARDEIGPVGGIAALVAVLSIMVILLAVLALVVVNALANSPWGTFSIAMTIPIALFMGFYLRVIRPGRVLETSLIGVVLLLIVIALGGWVQDSSLADAFTLEPETLVFCLIAYGFVASVLPVWMLLAPRDYLSTFMKIGTIVLLAIGIIVTLPVMENQAVTKFALQRRGPGVRGCAVPVRVHHDRVRRALRLPLPDRLRHDAEDDREGDAGPLHRLRRDADGVLRRGDGDDRRVDHRPGPLLRDELARGRDRRDGAVGLGVRQRPRLRDHAGGAAVRGHGGRGGVARLPHRRRARRSRSACPRSSPA